MPGNERGRPLGEGGPEQITTTYGPSIIADQGDPRRVGELLAAWVEVRMGEVDGLVAEARARVEALPDQRVLWSLYGELLLGMRALEHEVDELKRKRR